jgi:hypothetical protein
MVVKIIRKQEEKPRKRRWKRNFITDDRMDRIYEGALAVIHKHQEKVNSSAKECDEDDDGRKIR